MEIKQLCLLVKMQSGTAFLQGYMTMLIVIYFLYFLFFLICISFKAVPLLEMYLTGIFIHMERDICTRLFIAALQ